MIRQFLMPSTVYTGLNALDQASLSFKQYGHKALIIADPSMNEFGYLKQVAQCLLAQGIEWSTFTCLKAEPTTLALDEGVKQYKDKNCDFLIGLGGGSALDTMKAIAILVSSNRPLNTYINEPFEDNRPSMIAIPTTAGTGSEATQFTIIIDTTSSVKMLLQGTKLIPDVAIIDPSFTLSTPAIITKSTAVDALCHAIESAISIKRQDLSLMFSLDAIKKIMIYLPQCCKDPSDVEARLQLSIASFQAGCAFSNASVGLVHGLSRPLGANFHVAHGLSNALLLKKCLNYMKEDKQSDYAKIARYLGLTISNCDAEASTLFLNAIYNLLDSLELPSCQEVIKDMDRFNHLIEKMANDALASGSPQNNCPQISQSRLASIYRLFL